MNGHEPSHQLNRNLDDVIEFSASSTLGVVVTYSRIQREERLVRHENTDMKQSCMRAMNSVGPDTIQKNSVPLSSIIRPIFTNGPQRLISPGFEIPLRGLWVMNLHKYFTDSVGCFRYPHLEMRLNTLYRESWWIFPSKSLLYPSNLIRFRVGARGLWKLIPQKSRAGRGYLWRQNVPISGSLSREGMP